MTEAPALLTYSSVVSRESIRIVFMVAALNDLDVLVADIGNAYLKACGSHILCCVLCITILCTNVDPKCVSCSAKLISTDPACGCNRSSLRYSQAARYAHQMY